MTPRATLELDTGTSRYPIHIGPGLLGNGELLRNTVRGQQVFVVSNPTVAPLYLERVRQAFDGYRLDVHLMPDGEAFKTLETLGDVVGAMLGARHSRQTTILALGGGVVGDTAGFAAASYQRGVRFVQLPTTLLAQVDSSVGGKTAVNHPLGKNMIGAFYQPHAVIIDTDTLSTLPRRELGAGLAEVVKHGMLADWAFFEWIERNTNALLSLESDALTYAVQRSCEIKASVVAEDEKEAGVRALLNLGHTFGHAIEAAQGYGKWLHGEAVATGLVMAADLSARLGQIDSETAARIKALISGLQLPVSPPADMSAETFMDYMSVDKKATEAGVRFILLAKPGQAEIRDDVAASALEETLTAGENLCS